LKDWLNQKPQASQCGGLIPVESGIYSGIMQTETTQITSELLALISVRWTSSRVHGALWGLSRLSQQLIPPHQGKPTAHKRLQLQASTHSPFSIYFYFS
jgi:hypothetical protein